MPKMKYVGKGAYVSGVPARDLSASEWEALSKDLRKKALATGTHKETKSSPKEA